MKQSSKTRLQWAVLLSTAMMLAACGDSDSDVAGGGGATPPPAPPPVTGDVPGTAQATPSAWTTFVGAQVKSETAAGLSLTDVVAPFSETEAPLPI